MNPNNLVALPVRSNLLEDVHPDETEVKEPETFMCPKCHEWTDTEDPCCGAGPIYDYERIEDR